MLKCRIIEKGRVLHMYEIKHNMDQWKEHKAEVDEFMEKYKGISFPTIE
jgi:tRNA G37 N-methylase Trm5